MLWKMEKCENNKKWSNNKKAPSNSSSLTSQYPKPFILQHSPPLKSVMSQWHSEISEENTNNDPKLTHVVS